MDLSSRRVNKHQDEYGDLAELARDIFGERGSADPCQTNNGGCDSNAVCSYDSTKNSVKCTCKTGYGYTACGGSVCTAVCTTLCQNGGVCSAPNTCKCASGWTDATCSTPICSNSCKNGGQCTAPNKCTCTGGYGGLSCEIPPCDAAHCCSSCVSCNNAGTISYCRPISLGAHTDAKGVYYGGAPYGAYFGVFSDATCPSGGATGPTPSCH
ncbi:unnamed protein product [Adineta steineri]|uniref:EGF-like domain-containing protein n=1 Tax=Adineta steineri TaxID=433720 RepID=A0A815B0N6_9BILA|nr:unnamed protein product [Adineta steineri]CAF1417060.1 unnamed protein product [Adineta steineri]